MTIVVLVVLVLVWAVVLGPSLLRRTSDRQSKDSIGSFHRQLHVLGRTGPSLMAPAHRLGSSLPMVRSGATGPGRLVCFDATQSGSITRTAKIWSFDDVRSSDTTVAIADGLLYTGDAAVVFF